MPRERSIRDSDRGQPIRVIRGTYKGRHGCLHKRYGETDDKVYVILNPMNSHSEEVKQLNKTSIRCGPHAEPQIWEQALLKNKKVEPHYQTFLNKLLEAEYEPNYETLAVIYFDWKEQFEDRQLQSRSLGIIRVRTDLKHPTQRKKKENGKDIAAVFENVKGIMV